MLPKLRVPQAVEVLKLGVSIREPILMTGAPGIGKSDIVQLVRAELNMNLILSQPVVGDPMDAKGLPYSWTEKDGTIRADFIPYGDLHYAMIASKPTIWFIDDLGQAPPAVQAAYMQLLLAREINGKKISDNICFIAATNRRQDKAGVTGILEPVKSRFAMIFELEPNIEDFCVWAYSNKILPSIPAYLRFNNKHLLDFKPNNDMEPSPSPRTWAKLSKLLSNFQGDAKLRDKIIYGSIGEGAGRDFSSFEKLDLPDIDMLIRYPDQFMAPDAPDRLYAICAAIATRTTVDNIDNIVRLSERMKPQFAKMMMTDARMVCPNIDLTEAYLNYSQRIATSFTE